MRYKEKHKLSETSNEIQHFWSSLYLPLRNSLLSPACLDSLSVCPPPGDVKYWLAHSPIWSNAGFSCQAYLNSHPWRGSPVKASWNQQSARNLKVRDASQGLDSGGGVKREIAFTINIYDNSLGMSS